MCLFSEQMLVIGLLDTRTLDTELNLINYAESGYQDRAAQLTLGEMIHTVIIK